MLVVCTAAPALRDAPYWDANVYTRQGRWAAAHGPDLDAWRHFPDVLKPPVFAGVVLGVAAAVDRAAGTEPLAMHLSVLAFALALLFGVRALVGALGGSERQGGGRRRLRCAAAPPRAPGG